MDKHNEQQNLKSYRRGRLTILELMTVLSVLGVLLTWVLQRFS